MIGWFSGIGRGTVPGSGWSGTGSTVGRRGWMSGGCAALVQGAGFPWLILVRLRSFLTFIRNHILNFEVYYRLNGPFLPLLEKGNRLLGQILESSCHRG